ncbi:MAG TPA: hypothetical protein VK837_04135 [Longimicrobiales bacterium]|nr:hypothetical protein [Longimicrobiales bacterium]
MSRLRPAEPVAPRRRAAERDAGGRARRRVPGFGARATRVGGGLAGAVACVAVTGCAGLLPGPTMDPQGRSLDDIRLRQMVSAGLADSALAWLRAEPNRLPGDDVLDRLYFGVLTHQAGLYAESSLWLQAAHELAEDRYTKSISRSALSLLVNDRVLPYEPGETERMLIHYYNAKNHMALGDLDGAAVEARRLSMLLDRYDEESEPTHLRAGFRAFASAVFAAAGDRNDADVAARKARAQGVGAWWEPAPDAHPVADDVHFLGVPIDGDDAPGAPARGTGRVVVVVERGRIAQMVEESAFLTLDDDRRHHLRRGRHRRTWASLSLAGELAPETTGDAAFQDALEAARAEAEREAEEEAEEEAKQAAAAGDGRDIGGDDRGNEGATAPRRPTLDPSPERIGSPEIRRAGRDRRRARDDGDDDYDENPYIMRIAWATYRRAPVRTQAAPRLVVGEADAAAARLALDLSAGVIADDLAHRGWVIARAIARAGTKLAITRAIENEAGEKNEAVGRILGAVANAGAVLLERADTRSWALVPDRLEVLRIDLPAGDHPLAVRLGTGEVLDLGVVRVTDRATRILFQAAGVAARPPTVAGR